MSGPPFVIALVSHLRVHIGSRIISAPLHHS